MVSNKVRRIGSIRGNSFLLSIGIGRPCDARTSPVWSKLTFLQLWEYRYNCPNIGVGTQHMWRYFIHVGERSTTFACWSELVWVPSRACMNIAEHLVTKEKILQDVIITDEPTHTGRKRQTGQHQRQNRTGRRSVARLISGL